MLDRDNFPGLSHQSRSALYEIPIVRLTSRKLCPCAMSAIARCRVAWSYITQCLQQGLTFRDVCPGWDSNPHCAVFETAVSASWTTGARPDCLGEVRPSINLPGHDTLDG